MVLIRDQTARYVLSDLDLHCPQKQASYVVIGKKELINKNYLHKRIGG